MTASVFASIGLAATAVAAISFVTLHVLPTGLSAIHNAVSHYGITRYRGGYRALTVALGVAGLSSAAAVARAYPAPHRTTIVVLLALFGLCRLAISWWPMDSPGEPTSRHGSVHLALAAGAFLTVTVAANQMQRAVAPPSLPFGASYHDALRAAFWVLIIGLVGMLLTRCLGGSHQWFGAVERLVYAGIFILLVATGVAIA